MEEFSYDELHFLRKLMQEEERAVGLFFFRLEEKIKRNMRYLEGTESISPADAKDEVLSEIVKSIEALRKDLSELDRAVFSGIGALEVRFTALSSRFRERGI